MTPFQEAWELLEQFIESELDCIGGQDGTAEMWEALRVVRKGCITKIAAYHSAGYMRDTGQYCTNCKLQLANAGDSPFPAGEMILVDRKAMTTRNSMSEADTKYYANIPSCL